MRLFDAIHSSFQGLLLGACMGALIWVLDLATRHL